MSSPTSGSGFPPSPSPVSVGKHAPITPPCDICEAPSHNVDECPHAAAFLMRGAQLSWKPLCAQCTSVLHNADACPPHGEALDKRASHLHDLEPYARVVLKTGVPRAAPCCEVHSQIDHTILTRARGGILQHRALMPMCVVCVHNRLGQFKIEHAVFRSSIDSCNCAALVFDDSSCQWCIVEQLRSRRITYELTHRVIIQDLEGSQVAYLMCKCGRIPMGTPRNAASNTLDVREVMRLCAGCEGVVNVPLHHLDGEHHLACIPGKASRALVDDHGQVMASVDGEMVGMMLDEECFAHPVRTMGQNPIYAIPKRRSTTESSSSLRSGMEARSSASCGLDVPVCTAPRLAPSGGLGLRPPAFGEVRVLQHRPVPVARMVPPRPEEVQNDDGGTSSQLDQDFGISPVR